MVVVCANDAEPAPPAPAVHDGGPASDVLVNLREKVPLSAAVVKQLPGEPSNPTDAPPHEGPLYASSSPEQVGAGATVHPQDGHSAVALDPASMRFGKPVGQGAAPDIEMQRRPDAEQKSTLHVSGAHVMTGSVRTLGGWGVPVHDGLPAATGAATKP
jgi:hypothetical protein